jgi:Sec-independent protein translocase protein TatA
MFKRLIIIILTVVYFMFGAEKVRAGYMESSGSASREVRQYGF